MCKINKSSFIVYGKPKIVIRRSGYATIFLPKKHEEEDEGGVWISSDDVTEKTLLSEVDVVSRRKVKILQIAGIETVGDLFGIDAWHISKNTGIGEVVVKFWRRQIIEEKGYKPPFWIKI